jgi:hypothetical protein
VGFVVDKAALGQVFSENFGFPCQSFHQFLHHHNHLGLAQLAIGGRSAEWTQLDSTPTIPIKKMINLLSIFLSFFLSMALQSFC